MSFQQGLSGLNGAAKSLDVIGNNIANASTVGFKSSEAQFADVYASSLNGAGGNTAGIGTKLSNIAQQFTQGNVEASDNPLDIAINGGGFFRMSMGGVVQYTRNGQFALDKDGFLVNAQGAKLTGYGVGNNGAVLAGAPVPIQINAADIKPVATTRVDTQMNLNSDDKVPVTMPFDANDPTSYNKQVPVDVYDTLGNAHVMSLFYVKSATAGQWDVYMASDGVEWKAQQVSAAGQSDAATLAARTQWATDMKAIPPNPATIAADLAAYAAAAGAAVSGAAGTAGASAATQAAIVAAAGSAGGTAGLSPDDVDKLIAGAVKVPPVSIGHLNFDVNGALASATSSTLPLVVNMPIFPGTGAAMSLPVNVGFVGTTQYGAPTSEKKTTQDGYTAGHLQRFSAGPDGVILGQYSNGRSQPLGQIVLANFQNPNGLSALGNNAWAETSASGQPVVGVPNTGSMGVLQSSAVENSNVDLTAELVNMITAQRVYQANAQTIKTQDSVLQTLVNLR